MSKAKLSSLTQALRLPHAELHLRSLPTLGIKLYLLHLPQTELSLSAAQTAYFWQKLPYWAFAWAGGHALAGFILRHPEYVRGKTVLDFGCGSALVGIVCAKAGAKTVWVADLDDNALLAATLNAKENHVQVHAVQGAWPKVDVLLASDVLYDISSSDDLKQLMLAIPSWLLAESECVKPSFVELHCLERQTCATLPAIGDFDQAIDIEIYCRAGANVPHSFSAAV
ncbi:MAG: hypothetical protein RL217_372 [Pseudomonadota bacterium]|jgi:predicted nicotinamide N-methyase